MGETIIEKIIRHNTGKNVKPGDIVTVNVDRVMIHDIFIPFVAEKFVSVMHLQPYTACLTSTEVMVSAIS